MNRTKTKLFFTALAAVCITIGIMIPTGCSDPRNVPPTAADPGFTETIVLWQDAVSNGETVSATFSVDGPLAPVNQPGVDAPARLTVAAYIVPDADILWRERIIADSIPYWSDANNGLLIHYLIEISEGESVLDSVAAVRAICDSLPDQCPDDTSGLAGAEADAQAYVDLYQDSLALGVADTTRLGGVRDSLAAVVDDRFTLALWLDDDELTVYPEAVYVDPETLSGQHIFASPTLNGYKARSFRLNAAQFNAADINNPMRPIEINWAICTDAGTRACMSIGNHEIRARVNGADTRITGTIVLVYAEERNP